MIIAVCVEDRWGMTFHDRRLSMDSAVREKMLRLASGTRLWMDEYSWNQFEEAEIPGDVSVQVTDRFSEKAGAGEICFLEKQDPAALKEEVEGVLLFRWNRTYPADRYFPAEMLEGLSLKRTEEFAGSSHEKITLEVYGR